jgi:hypothetical protein
MKTFGLAVVLAVVACGNGRRDASSSSPPAAVPAGSGIDAASQKVAVRLLGVRAPGSVRTRVAALELTVDGRAFPAHLEGGELDLGNDQQAWAVTMLDLPADAHKLAIQLQFQPDGLVERNGKSQALDLRGPPISLVADAALMRTQSHVVLEIDIARSLVDRGGQAFLMPEFIVRY